MTTITLTTEELNNTLKSLSSYIYSLDTMIEKTNDEQYLIERNKIQELKNLLIKYKRGLAE
jgi:phosphoglycerate-specific signal transduction histidine kinase